jgi:hypothetical protein
LPSAHFPSSFATLASTRTPSPLLTSSIIVIALQISSRLA